MTTPKPKARTRRGFGRIRAERSGRYSAAYIGPDEQLHRAPHTYASKVDAEGWLASERRKIELGTWGAAERSDGVTLEVYAKRWLSQRTLTPRTRDHYASMLERLIVPTLGDERLASLTPARVREWYAELGTERKTRNAHVYALLHAICTTALADEVLDSNPCRIRSAMSTKRRREIEVLSPAQLAQLASYMPDALQASVLLAGWCGLRWSETSELRRKDVSEDCSVLRIRRAVTYRSGVFTVGQPKAGSIRDVVVPPHIRPILKAHLATHVDRGAESLLFPDFTGEHLRADLYRTHWEKARELLGKPHFRVHDLRHTGLVYAAQSGATTKELMHRAGHQTPEMALRYQHVAEGRDAAIAERMSQLATG